MACQAKRVGKDISETLAGWEYDPDQVSVRIVTGDDGREKIQLRLDLGLLQMEFEGRPDGLRIDGGSSWLAYFEQKQREHDAKHPDGAPFLLESDECLRLMREGVQYYHRYISFWHLERYELCARDTNRNLRLFKFVREHARHPQDKLQFDQWRPYVTMMHARAVATPLIGLKEFAAALGAIDAGIEAIRSFLREYEQLDNAEKCSELVFMLRWRDEVESEKEGAARREPYNPIVRLEGELQQAISEERFEDAAQLRDAIRRYSHRPIGPGSNQPL
ncbi:MAG TPA: UvrB/UvrC motif-containing protein [Pirellulales bacterium]|nr:UvrB/UvrC motif-containing protein [Pirellulales bacterium]